MKIARIMNISNMFMFCFIAVFCLIMHQLYAAVHDYMEMENKKYTSLELAAELRNSSRLLTENFRLYIMTEDPEYERKYWKIVEERSGITPRSHDKKVAPGETVKLNDLLQENIFFHDHIPTIKKANMLSDDLIHFESSTMNMVTGSIHAEPDIIEAKELAYSAYYISKTHEIMNLLDIFYNDINDTSKIITEKFKTKISNYLVMSVIIFIMFAVITLLLRIYTYIYIYSPINRITQFANTIVNGNTTQRIKTNVNNEIGKLCFTLNLMLDKLQDEILTSGTDPLTHLCNRRFFEKKLDELKMLTQYRSQALSILILDIDFFKRVNDRFGHLCGDDVLRCFAENMRKCCRKEDIVARLGGEEFAILLPMPASEAAILAERIRDTMEKAGILPDGTSVTCSIGITQYAPGEKTEEFLERADQALYRAKEEGRNRVRILEKASFSAHGSGVNDGEDGMSDIPDAGGTAEGTSVPRRGASS